MQKQNTSNPSNKILIRLAITLLLAPITATAQLVHPNDTIRINKGMGENGTYRTIFHHKTRTPADRTIDNAAAVVLSSARFVDRATRIDTLTVQVNNDSFTLVLPYSVVLYELTLDKERDYQFELDLKQLKGNKETLLNKATTWLKHEYRNDKRFKIYPDDTTGRLLAAGCLEVEAGSSRYLVYHQLMVATRDTRAKITIGNFTVHSYNAPDKTFDLSCPEPPKGLPGLGKEEWEELQNKTGQVMNLLLLLFWETMTITK